MAFTSMAFSSRAEVLLGTVLPSPKSGTNVEVCSIKKRGGRAL
jgi:hypothetical protein